MKVANKVVPIKKLICLLLYYGIAKNLPISKTYWNVGGSFRFFLCRRIFKKCGTNVNIEKGAWFGSGQNIEIGDYSGIGINAHIPSDTIIGKYVMMGPNCYILEFPTPIEAAVVGIGSLNLDVKQLVFRYFALSA